MLSLPNKKRADPYITAITSVLTEAGVREWTIERGHRGHPRVVFFFRGRRCVKAFPGTPSDRSGHYRAAMDTRRILRTAGWAPSTKEAA